MSAIINPLITTGVSFQVPPNGWNISGMFFDAWLSLHHDNSLTITQHPVETGATISDHCYVNPPKFSFDIGETDVVSSPVVPGASTRSINAYITLLGLMQSRQLLTLDSKYGHYENILIESIGVSDTFQTKTTLKATVNLIQIIVANTQNIQNSSNPNATNSTNRGQVPAIPALGTPERIAFFWNQTFKGF